MRTPAADGFRMPPETAAHERTLMAWPCRTELWGAVLAQAKDEYAGVANAIAAFEPVTMVCAGPADAAQARAALTGAAHVIELPIDDSWLRDSGPVFVLGTTGDARAGVHFGFNAWGEKYAPYDRDAAVGARLIEHVGDELYRAPFVLEGGSVLIDAHGTLVTTQQCLLSANRNAELSGDQIERGLRDYLGADRVVWLGDGLAADRDTDGHVDLIAAFTDDGALLLQSAPPGAPDHEPMAENHARATAAGLAVIDFPLLGEATVAGAAVTVAYLNVYAVNGAVVVPLSGGPQDAEAVERVGAAFGGREVVGVPAAAVAFGGGGPHCITQQVPAVAG